jgi:hypothetical protein
MKIRSIVKPQPTEEKPIPVALVHEIKDNQIIVAIKGYKKLLVAKELSGEGYTTGSLDIIPPRDISYSDPYLYKLISKLIDEGFSVSLIDFS